MKKFKGAMDFVQDEDFLRWVKLGRRDAVLDKKWKNYFLLNPDKHDMADEARLLLISVTGEKQHNLSEQRQKELWRKIDGTIAGLEPAKKEKNHFLVTYSIAATISLLVAAAVFLLNPPAFLEEKSVATPVAIQVKDLIEFKNLESTPHNIVLEDGSTVSLQPNSSLKYPANFSGTKREVYLSGEGFFKITKNPDKPFLVHANELVTQVLGTSFNVRAYDGERHVSVIVKTGKVSVYPENDTFKKGGRSSVAGTFLLPNQQVVYSRDEKWILKSLVEEPTMLSSKTALGEFVFVDTPISEVFTKLESTYGISIIYDEEVLRNCMLNASLADLSFYDKLRVICKGINAQYEVLDAHIIISGTGCK